MAALWMTPALLTAVSIHPLKNQDHMYRIHSFFKLKDYQVISAELDELSDELKKICSKLPRQDTYEGHKSLIECLNQW